MEAMMFHSKILQNGIIKIPELSKWSDSEVSIVILMKNKKT
jgi:hypothetical protein